MIKVVVILLVLISYSGLGALFEAHEVIAKPALWLLFGFFFGIVYTIIISHKI